MRPLLYLAFVLSGAAGLMYESVWSRYLGLFVGHSAYAQIIVLTIFLGGMALGAWGAGQRTERVREPLVWYAAIELAVGVASLFFDDVYGGVTRLAYETLFPTIGWAPGVLAVKWALAALLILPQSILLGTTFPLMTAGILRRAEGQTGRVLALLYFANSIGAAAGVLLAGFYLVRLAGLPGTLLVAAMLNMVVALVTFLVAGRQRQQARAAAAAADAEHADGLAAEPAPTFPAEPIAAAPVTPAAAPPPLAGLPPLPTLQRLLLAVSCGTAIASFIYEIAWIRMLSLVLGAATHSFELMLSAFILGLALGALWVHRRADTYTNPLRVLGIVQWAMGFLALATLPVYLASFQWTAALVDALDLTERGYHAFNLARYALCLAVMLPSTFCAGMTLPLITRTLMAAGSGERAVGRVYAANTFGSIIGVVLASLVLMPLVGVKTLLIAGATMDMILGVLLLAPRLSAVPTPRWLRAGAGWATVAAAALAIGYPMPQAILTSGVFRYGTVADPASVEVLGLRDGRTAQVALTQRVGGTSRSLLTNGKPDASLDVSWLKPVANGVPSTMGGDIATQVLLPLITLAHQPEARRAAVIGFGSGLSSHYLLSSPRLEELVTIEIEPEMIDAARTGFYPANGRAFDDPRSTFVVDDAKSYFATARTRYDLILSEPSNPWVSGVSGLFTVEFYERVKEYLADDGIFGQWLHLYEIDDELVVGVLAAIHQQFGSYEIFLTSNGDILIVAAKGATLPKPAWDLIARDAAVDLRHVVALTPERLESLRLIGRDGLAPLLERSQANSDFYPILDLGAERTRYLRKRAAGFVQLRAARFDVAATYAGRRYDFGHDTVALVPAIAHTTAQALAARLRQTAAAGRSPAEGGGTMASLPGGREVAQRQWIFRSGLGATEPPADWALWMHELLLADQDLHMGTAGVVDERFFGAVTSFLARHDAPADVRTAVAYLRALSAWDFATVVATGDTLMRRDPTAPTLVPIDLLRDGLVVAHLRRGDAASARRIHDELAPRSSRAAGDLRSSLLDAYVREAELTALKAQFARAAGAQP